MHSKVTMFKRCTHWIATMGVFVLTVQVGIKIGWSSPNIARLTSNGSDIPVTLDQASWIISINSLGGLVGAFSGLLGLEFLGSRKTLFMALLFSSVSWSFMIIANSVGWLYASRAIGGVTTMLTYSSFSMYLAEMADPKIRGTLISIAAGGNPFGIVVGTIAETYLPRRVSSSIYLVMCVLALVLFTWLRDTPYYLARTEKLKRARRSVAFYRHNCNLDKEMQEITSFIDEHASQSFRDRLRDLISPEVRKPLFLVVTLFALPHFSGTIVIASYMELILKNGKSNLIEPKQYVIYANVASVISTMLTFRLMDKLGRRWLLIVSSIGTTMAMAGLGIHFYLLDQGVDSDSLQWLPVVCIFGYLVTYAVGFSPVPSTVMSELFTDNVKSMAVLASTLFGTLVSFTIVKSYQPLVDLVGQTYVFWMHAVLSFMATPYALFLLPETKGKTFQEIQDALNNKK